MIFRHLPQPFPHQICALDGWMALDNFGWRCQQQSYQTSANNIIPNGHLNCISASAAFLCSKLLKLKIESSSCNISAPAPAISPSNVCPGVDGWHLMPLDEVGQQIGYQIYANNFQLKKAEATNFELKKAQTTNFCNGKSTHLKCIG